MSTKIWIMIVVWMVNGAILQYCVCLTPDEQMYEKDKCAKKLSVAVSTRISAIGRQKNEVWFSCEKPWGGATQIDAEKSGHTTRIMSGVKCQNVRNTINKSNHPVLSNSSE